MDSRNCGLCEPCARGDYAQCDHIGRPMAPEPQKYDDTLMPFLALMRAELHANTRKGDRPGWLTMSKEVLLLEIYWHTAKLSAAVKNGSADGVREHSADVANMAMMLADVCGVLADVHFPCVDDVDNERLKRIDAIDRQAREVYTSQGPRGLIMLCKQLLAEREPAPVAQPLSIAQVEILNAAIRRFATPMQKTEARKLIEQLSSTAAPTAAQGLSDAEIDPLQGAANWLVKAIGPCGAIEIGWRLSIGHNRASRLYDAAILSAAQETKP